MQTAIRKVFLLELNSSQFRIRGSWTGNLFVFEVHETSGVRFIDSDSVICNYDVDILFNRGQ